VFIGIFIFVFVFITAGMSLVTERTGGTMERLLVSPIKSWQLVAGYCLGFGVVTIIQAGIVLASAIWLIGFPNEGNFALVIVITFSMALVSMTLGLLVSALARTAFQVIQLMILLVVPQILLSGIFDLDNAPTWMQVLSVCFPIRHGADALRGVMLRGEGLDGIGLSLVILWGFIVAFFIMAVLSFRVRRTG
jgi:ABC-2 type transport system permease protein